MNSLWSYTVRGAQPQGCLQFTAQRGCRARFTALSLPLQETGLCFLHAQLDII